jgi:hypothetical protein
MLGNISSLNFFDHDITDEQKFPELAREKYLCIKSVTSIGVILLEMQMWAIGIEKLGILNLLKVPHFGCILEINACDKLLLSCIHGGTLWIEPPMLIDTKLIVWITGIPKEGEDPTTLFNNKAGEKSQS